MLNEENKAKLAEMGFEVDTFIDAVSSSEEVSIEIPTLYKDKGHSNDDLTSFGKNRFEEGKKAAYEMRAKAYKEQYGIDIDGKDLDKVVEAIKQQGFSEAKPDEGAKELKDNFTQLQNRYSELEKQFSEKDKEIENERFKLNLRKELETAINGQKTKIGKDEIIDLFLLRNKIDRDNGQAVLVENGEVKKDNLLNPIKIQDHFKAWFDSKEFASKEGMGGGDSGGGSAATKFSNASEFMDWCAKTGKEPSYAMSEEGQKYYLANKAK